MLTIALSVRKFATVEKMNQLAAEAFVRISNDAITARTRFTVMLSGGSTPRRFYELLATPPYRDQMAWEKMDFFWGDERSVRPDHPDSNYRMAREALLNEVPISDGPVHRMPAERAALDDAAREYQAEIARSFDIHPYGGPPRFDLILLGMGTDGHTASLFPHTHALKESSRWVVPNYVPKLDSYRLTLTPLVINHAACVMFLVAGANKAESLARVIAGPADPEKLPAQLINPTSGSLAWFVDTSAASKLAKRRTSA